MNENKSLKILKLLLSGSPVKLNNQLWYMGENHELGCKMERSIDGVKQPDDGTIHCAEWTLGQFLSECEKLTDSELVVACGEELQSSLIEVRNNEVLFRDGRQLGEDTGRVLSGIVQNDTYMTQEEFSRFGKDLESMVNKIIAHGEKTVLYIQNKLWDHNVPFKGNKLQNDYDDDIPF